MIRRGVTVNLNDYQAERVDIEFPAQFLPPGMTDADEAFKYASTWVETRLRNLVETVVRREAARGNRIDAPFVGPPESLDPPAPVAIASPPVPGPIDFSGVASIPDPNRCGDADNAGVRP